MRAASRRASGVGSPAERRPPEVLPRVRANALQQARGDLGAPVRRPISVA
jgi:hypothetical protein